MPPSSTGRALSPAAWSTLAATAARGPDSQIVTSGRPLSSPASAAARAGDRDAAGAWTVARRERLRRAHVEHDRLVRYGVDPVERRLGAEQLAAVQLDDPLHVRRPWRLRAEPRVEEVGELALERRVEAALEADGRRRLRAHRGTAERPRDVAGEDLDAVPELDEPAQAVEEALGSLARLDRQIRPA